MNVPGMETHVNNPAHAADFVRINRAWIERYFAIEPNDLKIFANPLQIVEDGGYLISLTHNGQVVGVCALVPEADGSYELAKMGVDEAHLGQGWGSHLMQAAIDLLTRLQARHVILYTNSQLTPAIRIYEKFGFRPVQDPVPSHYSRVDLIMEKSLP